MDGSFFEAISGIDVSSQGQERQDNLFVATGTSKGVRYTKNKNDLHYALQSDRLVQIVSPDMNRMNEE